MLELLNMKLYSTLDRKVVPIKPLKEGEISIYSCGPTVYSRAHIGNLRSSVNWDILQRAFTYLGYDVKRIMNMTDVGHMTADEDFGEDKIGKQASAEGLKPIEIANKYIDTVLDDFRLLNILSPTGETIPDDLDHKGIAEYGFPRATDYIDQMIDVVKKIEENGYTYETKQALYFDVTKVKDYTIFTGQKLEEKEVAVREEVDVDPDKKHPADFVLWMKKYGKYEDHLMNWESPWGIGFPGWHIECSAMSTSILGKKFDIHTGGIDLLSVHHPNERAQNIGAYGSPSVKYWIHNEWLVNVDDDKMSKSAGNAEDLPSVLELGFDPLDVRHLFISVNYRRKIRFSSEALEGARNARLSIVRKIGELGTEKGEVLKSYRDRFEKSLKNNLNMSEALALISELLKSDHPKKDILATVLDFDKVLGLDLEKSLEEQKLEPKEDPELERFLEERIEAKKEKDYDKADKLRNDIEKLGYKVLDTKEGQKLEKI
jgi:cysteinyl-tRNA synthetase